MRKVLIAAGLAVLASAAIVTAAVAKPSAESGAASLASCTNVSLGVNAPLTGPAGFLGQEQLSWAQFAVSKYNKQYEHEVQDRPGRLRSSRPRSRARSRSSSSPTRASSAVVGASTSQGVDLERRLFEGEARCRCRGSATRVGLTTGANVPDVLPGCPERLDAGAERRELLRIGPEGEERRGDGLAGRLLDAACRRASRSCSRRRA